MSNSGSTLDQLRVANIELVQRFIEAINDSWNINEMRELVSDDFVFVIPFAPTGSRCDTRGESKRWRSWTACAICCTSDIGRAVRAAYDTRLGRTTFWGTRAMNPDDQNCIDEVASDIDDLKTTVDEFEEDAASTGEATALKKLKNALEQASDATDALEDEQD